MKNFLRLKQDTEVDIDGMLVDEKEKKIFNFKKVSTFNLSIFSILGLFTLFYLNAIQPSLVKKTSENHLIIIKNTSDHIERLGIEFNRDGIKQFLLSTRFLFQGLDRVQFFSTNGDLIGDTNILDLDVSVFERSDEVIEEGANINENKNANIVRDNLDEKDFYDLLKNKYKDQPITIENKINNSFFVSTISDLKIKDNKSGFIMVTNEANDILLAVKERKKLYNQNCSSDCFGNFNIFFIFE